MSVSPFHCKHKYTGSRRGIELRKTHEKYMLHQVKGSLGNICFGCDRVSVLFGKGKKYVLASGEREFGEHLFWV